LSWLLTTKAEVVSKSTTCPWPSVVGAPGTAGEYVRFVPATAPTMRYRIDSGARFARRVAYGGTAYSEPNADTGGTCWCAESQPPPVDVALE
jgi:hypothetical protein